MGKGNGILGISLLALFSTLLSARGAAPRPAEIQLEKSPAFVASILDENGDRLAGMGCQIVGCWFPPCWHCQSQDNTAVLNVGNYQGVTSSALVGSLLFTGGSYSVSCLRVDWTQSEGEICSVQ